MGSTHRALIPHLPPTTTVQVTAYCDSGTTRFGATTHLGIAATDIHVIHNGTHFRLRIPPWLQRRFASYLPAHDRFDAEDTGGAVVGNVVDIWMPDCNVAWQWGRQHLVLDVIAAAPLRHHRYVRRRYRQIASRKRRAPAPQSVEYLAIDSNERRRLDAT